MIAVDKLPLSFTENRGFGRFCRRNRPHYSLPSRRTITRLMEDRYEIFKKNYVLELEGKTSYSLTMDNWTDEYTKQTYLAVTIHYLSNDMEMIDGILGMFPLYVNHTSEYLKVCFKHVMSNFGLDENKVVSVTTDRGANILRAVEEFFGAQKQIPCFGHVLALVFPDFTEKISTFQTVIKKVRAIVNSIRSSTVAVMTLKKLQKDEGIPQNKCLNFQSDVSTRWNSTLHMLRRFLQLKDYVYPVTLECKNPPQFLDKDDYEYLDDIIPMMALVDQATVDASGSTYTTASLVIPLLSLMKNSITEIIPKTKGGEEFKKKMIDALAARSKLLEKNDVLCLATLLDPRFKKMYFQSPLRVSTMVEKILILTKQEKKLSQQPQETLEENKKKSIWDAHDASLKKNNVSEHSLPEIKMFLGQQLCCRQSNPIKVWNDQLRMSFPLLFPLALKFLTVPCTSVASERANSLTHFIASAKRSNLTGEHVNEFVGLSSYSRKLWGLEP